MAKGFGGLLAGLEEAPDPRRQCANTKHLLPEILLMGFAAVLAGSGSFTDMATFANERRAFFASFLKSPCGVPAHDTFRAVFMAVDPRKLQAVLVARLAERLPDLDTSHVRLDGKTLRGSARPSSGLAALHPATGAEKSVEMRHDIGSMAPKVKRMAELARGHWGIENGLHWTLDVTFGADGQTTADRTAAENMATMNRVAVS